MEPEHHLIRILESRQEELGMRDVPFAQHIYISQPHWSMIKRGKRRIGRRMAQKILRRFPDLWRDVQDAMFPRETVA